MGLVFIIIKPEFTKALMRIYLRQVVKGFNSEVKFEDEPRRSIRSGSKKVSSKLIMSRDVHSQVSSGARTAAPSKSCVASRTHTCDHGFIMLS